MNHFKFGKRFLSFCLAGLLWLTTPAAAQPVHSFETPLRSTGSLPFYADVCQFEGASGLTRVEIVYALSVTKPSGIDSQEVRIDLRLFDRNQVYADLHEQKKFFISSDSALTFIDLKKFEVPADTVTLQLEMREG